MSIKIWHLPLILFLIMVISCTASGQSKPNLVICGIWQLEEDQAENQEFADDLHATYIRTYYTGWENNPQDVQAVLDATPSFVDVSDKPVEEEPATYGGFVNRNVITSEGLYADYRYKATELNGLTDGRLNGLSEDHQLHYDTIYAHSGGGRTAVTALLYQDVTCDKLVLVDPGMVSESEIQQLLDKGIDIVYYYYSHPVLKEWEEPVAGHLWRGEISEGDFQYGGDSKGYLLIKAVESKALGGETGNNAHKQIWEYALSEESQAIRDRLDEEKSYKPIPKSLLKEEFLESLKTPLLSPSDSGPSWGFEGTEDVPETSGDTSTYFDKANDVWYVDALAWSGDRSLYPKPAAPLHFVSGERNPVGYNWIYLPFERTGLTYDQGYLDWVTETLASMGMPGPTAGYGVLV